MEQRKLEKGHLKTRLLRNISVVLVFCMMLGTGVSTFYFWKIVKEQKIQDEQFRQEQLSGQLAFTTEDIRNFAKSIIVDEDIQGGLERQKTAQGIEALKISETMSMRLRFYNSMRPYILGSFISLKDGTGYSSSDSIRQSGYLQQRLEIEQLKEYVKDSEHVFSDPYYGTDKWDSKQVVCFCSRIFDKYHFGEELGRLYLEIDLEHFTEQIENYGREYEQVWVFGNEGYLLYGEDSGEEISKLSDKGYFQDGVFRVDGGYLISKKTEETGWTLCTLLTSGYLWQQCSFVPQFLILSFLISIAVILFSTSKRMEEITKPITYLSVQMGQANYGSLCSQEVVHTGDEIETLYECYNDMIREIRHGIEAQAAYEKREKEMEFDIMLSQINPHYLYNVLNTVVYLSAAGKNKEVAGIVNSLVFTLQETLKLGERNVETTVQKELELTQAYVNIQRYRYPDMFRTEILCEETLKNKIVPKTVIQPLVENAILHGILPDEEPGTVTVRIEACEEKDSLWIVVEDDGCGISEGRLEQFEQGEALIDEKNGRKHIGISNIRDRIRYLYGEPYGMKIERRSQGGTRVTLRLPIKCEQNL